MRRFETLGSLVLAAVSVCLAAPPAKIVLIAGKPSHPPGAHEHTAGLRLLEKWLIESKAAPVVVTADGRLTSLLSLAPAP